VNHLGFILNSTITNSTAGIGPVTIYSPSSGTASWQLPGGTYLALIQANYTYSVIPNSTNINMQYGIQYSTTAVYSSQIGVANFNETYNFSNLTQSPIDNVCPLTFVVPPGNTNYYFAYAYFGLGSLVNGGTVTASIKVNSLIRIA